MPVPRIPLNYTPQTDDAMRAAAAEFCSAVKTRRSVRDFSPRAVPREVIEDSLQAAGSAPSGANLQPWHFVAMNDPAVKRRIREAAEEEEREFYASRATEEWLSVLEPIGTNEEKPFLESAPWLIAIFAVNAFNDAEGRRQQTYYPKESVGIAAGILITALHFAGLATLTHTPSPMRFLNEILGRPATEKPFLLLVVGHPADGATVPDIRRKDLTEIATFV